MVRRDRATEEGEPLMPYTLMKGLAWVLLAVLLGILVGWFMRHVTARRQVARARSHNVDAAELDRLRARVAELEAAAAERADLRAEPAVAPAVPRASASPRATPGPRSTSTSSSATSTPTNDEAVGDGPPPDVGATGEPPGVETDDLTAIEGIGPKVRELCHGIGIRTWADLAQTEVSLLRTMLADAGPRFRTHDPSTWPEQASLLAAGRWAEFKALTDELHGGPVSG